ncbi:aldehyde dehydrogenase (NADP(+)) [Massilia antarctica]|uniref:aldehyde dehydrogenase (NADP(+)) n=1 Tax=Massilia antarctica TaxID=2765360 RepID=UPI0006BB5ABD|nr:aldehyde dehydrogenase (NADP(+)) [Massilia sp. H27-R4]MCY0911562.1 aldehyde dehydrogenase (NADP(+)) [Massilia sp. H27-R4]CUI04820.1 Ketoglutarate semialdehyde dehydrogenase [Janthinobacterium sp. CG23_2]CUU28606.1 Ketoglutarate semialdehyde dehydrogenase [Janthinobacterium sp. CG23_2]
MTITGEALIGGRAVRGNGGSFQAFDPSTRAPIEPSFHMVDAAQIDEACRLAEAAFDPFRASSNEARATFLETIAAQILELGDELIVRAMTESGLPRARLEGERGRTMGQLKLFADLLREGSWADVRIDSALPDRQPVPRPDLRLRMIGLGPVAVFAASNFPLAFSVAGGDTAAALAAGCPVVLKAHSAHPGTSELVARAVVKAIELCKLPAGVFALLTGTGNGIGQALVAHPSIKAVGFTGSRSGGQALMAVAAARAQPIPVYAEMSSINPFFLMPEALAARGEQIATAFAGSMTMGVGQFCTNPGLVLGLKGPDFDRFADKAAQALSSIEAGTMLTAGIAAAYQSGVHKLAQHEAVDALKEAAHTEGKGGPALFRTTGKAFLTEQALHGEIFGPASLLVACDSVDEMRAITESLEGQLTATVQMDEGDTELVRALLPVLERKVGRILANGMPTGVEVSTAMVHGGPFPATSDGRSSSVGTAAIQRFLRPVCYQNLAQSLLPEVLRDDNEGVWRRRDGALTKS